MTKIDLSGLPPYNAWLTDIYEFIVKEYVEEVYVDIIETYVISTIKVIITQMFSLTIGVRGSLSMSNSKHKKQSKL